MTTTTGRTFFAEAAGERPQGLMGHRGFLYGPGSRIFGSRPGAGPLLAAVDTNIVIDITQQLEEVDRFGIGALDVELWDDEVVALGDLLAVWFWRDIRFFIPESILEDAHKPLAPARLRSRESAVQAFAADYWQRGGSEVLGWDEDGGSLEPMPAQPVHEHQLRLDITEGTRTPAGTGSFPKGFDGDLVLDALGARCHVLLTRDNHIIRCFEPLARAGLWVGSPADLLRELVAAHEFAEGSLGDAPFPDLQTVATFYALKSPETA